MYIPAEQVIELGVSRSTLRQKLDSGEWRSRGQRYRRNKSSHVLVASLPLEYQIKLLQRAALSDSRAKSDELIDVSEYSHENQMTAALLRLPPEERSAWIDEALRLANLVERYASIKPKRRSNPETGDHKFVPAVDRLCEEMACKSQVILKREPHRADPPSPYTLDDWLRAYREEGLLVFFRKAPTTDPKKIDNRLAAMSKGAMEWINNNWQTFRSPGALYDAIRKMGKEKGWTLPSRSWFYRTWINMPEIVKTFHLEGETAYISKHAPYVPRDYTDLQALQVLCGDHSERDVTILLPDGTLARPWSSLWYDLRTGLIWGWHMDSTPSSQTAGLAYADGIRNFGAQPPSRPEDGYYSYVYTDHDRTYKSHHWDGSVIAVHRQAMQIDGGLEFLLVQRRVGILDDFSVKHLLARRRNGREKPVERVHKVISDWEENSFKEYCGRDAKSRPDCWHKLYARHLQFTRGKRSDSPFMSFEEYREEFAAFVARYNSSAHQRATLGGKSIVPIDEYRRLYPNRYEIGQEALALLLMKADKRVIGKDGVQCFQSNWFYYHEAMSEFKGLTVEVRYSDEDYNRVWVVLPNSQLCEAILITPTSLINPNKRTLKAVSEAKAHERALIKNFHLVKQSQIRGETTETRVAKRLESESTGAEMFSASAPLPNQAVVHKLTRMDRKKLRVVSDENKTSSVEVAAVVTDDSIFDQPEQERVSEFDGDGL